MHKIALIIKREYLSRVRKKTFIISTILFPLLYLGLIFGQGYLIKKSKQNLYIAIKDQSGLFKQELVEKVNYLDTTSKLALVNLDEKKLIQSYDSLGYKGYIIIPSNLNWNQPLTALTINSKKTIGELSAYPIESKLNMIWNEIKNEKLGIDIEKWKQLNGNKISVSTKNIKDESVDTGTAPIFGYVAGFLMYFILLIYGSQVMMGVMEEKTNRIAEVVVSSVKPFHLMIGKIIGIGMVALTQFLLWIAFIFIVYNVGSAYSGGTVTEAIGATQKAFASVNLPIVVGCFIFYMLGGFFFYSSLYAAIGSAINEDMREAQSLSFPITMLVIFSIFMLSISIADPTGSVAFWGSIIPFSSPIVMLARIPFGVPSTVPWWELGLSMILLIAGFLFTTWFAGKIYRTGILMYGKKPTWKEMLKWVFRKN